MRRYGANFDLFIGGSPIRYRPMRLVTHEDYLQFRQGRDSIRIEQVEVKLVGDWDIEKFSPPEDYAMERFNIWSFPDRGDWATHVGNYRGNWSPYIPRNLILRYTDRGDIVLDQMMGSGTTLVECRLLDRRGIGVDINGNAAMVARDRLNFSIGNSGQGQSSSEILTYEGDARFLNCVEDESIDLVATHPPYADIISYSKRKPIEGDLSGIHDINEYVGQIRKIAHECNRVIKPGKHCGILIGDTRRRKHHVPISFRVMQSFLEAGFILKEGVIKHQWKTKSERSRWRGQDHDFLLLAYEQLFVFRKPHEDEKLGPLKDSCKWW